MLNRVLVMETHSILGRSNSTSIGALIIGILIVIGLVGCSGDSQKGQKVDSIEQETFGTLEDGREVSLFTLTNTNGMEVELIEYGARVKAIRTPDRDGEMASVITEFNTLEKYRGPRNFYGATIGRFGNRIANGTFTLDDTEYQLPTNDDAHHLHGGPNGFHTKLWDASITDEGTVEMRYLSEDGESGYPGNLSVTVTFELTDKNGLRIDYRAKTDKATPINLTNHSYFNLSGHPDSTILSHQLKINAGKYMPITEEVIPTGEIQPVEGTPFDFTEFYSIGSRMDKLPAGYDHNFVLRMEPADSLFHAATLYSPSSGREMKVLTVEPGLQFYSGNFLDGTVVDATGSPIEKFEVLCLESQHFPNAPNEADFPSTILHPDETYHSVTVYQFSTRK